MLRDKAELAGIVMHLVNERGTSSTCPTCRNKISKPAGRTMTCRPCQLTGHRDLFAAATIATRTPGRTPATDAGGGSSVTTATVVLPRTLTHRRAGRHLPGAGLSRRDPRRPTPHRPPPSPVAAGAAPAAVGVSWPAEARPTTSNPVGSRSTAPRGEEPQHHPPGERSWSQH
ncbi:zinc ribbon domain-containing protein [Dactylosporangium cerinum]